MAAIVDPNDDVANVILEEPTDVVVNDQRLVESALDYRSVASSQAAGERIDPNSRMTALRQRARATPAKREKTGAEPASTEDKPKSLVDVSAFGPPSVKKGGEALIQIYLHDSSQADQAALQAREGDADATRRDVSTLEVEVAMGSQVEILLEAPGATIDRPTQKLAWRGTPRACKFKLSVARYTSIESLTVNATVFVDNLPVGFLAFRLAVGVRAPKGLDIKGDEAKHFEYAFLSYASEDRAEVLKRAQGIRAVGVDFFQDLLDLDPGERWDRRLYEEIDRCDVFLLFWSRHASESEWVLAETDHAMARRGDRFEKPPRIVPVILTLPPPLPPSRWKQLHFNDWLASVISQVEKDAATKKRRATR